MASPDEQAERAALLAFLQARRRNSPGSVGVRQ